MRLLQDGTVENSCATAFVSVQFAARNRPDVGARYDAAAESRIGDDYANERRIARLMWPACTFSRSWSWRHPKAVCRPCSSRWLCSIS